MPKFHPSGAGPAGGHRGLDERHASHAFIHTLHQAGLPVAFQQIGKILVQIGKRLQISFGMPARQPGGGAGCDSQVRIAGAQRFNATVEPAQR